jgi:carbamoyl-phosphate synthase large subunit
VARSLKRYWAGASPLLYGTDTNPRASGLYDRELYEETRVVPPASATGYWNAIERLVREWKVDFALIQPEAEVIKWAGQSESAGLPCPTLVPSSALAKALTDKSVMTDWLRGTDLVPPSAVFEPGRTTFAQLAAELGNPFWIRATSGSSGLGSLKVSSESEMLNWLSINPGVERFIASAFLPGRNLACKLLYWKGKLVRSACGERVNYIMAKVAPSGITGNTSFGRLLNYPALVDRAVGAMDILFRATKSEPHGFFTVDFKEDSSGKPMITEVNVRMVAFNLCFAMAGANFSSDIARLLSGDASFDATPRTYSFPEGTIFLRDVDAEPILMNEADLLHP